MFSRGVAAKPRDFKRARGARHFLSLSNNNTLGEVAFAQTLVASLKAPQLESRLYFLPFFFFSFPSFLLSLPPPSPSALPPLRGRRRVSLPPATTSSTVLRSSTLHRGGSCETFRDFCFLTLSGYQVSQTWPVDEIIEAFLRSGLGRSSALEFLVLRGGSTLWRKFVMLNGGRRREGKGREKNELHNFPGFLISRI